MRAHHDDARAALAGAFGLFLEARLGRAAGAHHRRRRRGRRADPAADHDRPRGRDRAGRRPRSRTCGRRSSRDDARLVAAIARPARDQPRARPDSSRPRTPRWRSPAWSARSSTRSSAPDRLPAPSNFTPKSACAGEERIDATACRGITDRESPRCYLQVTPESRSAMRRTAAAADSDRPDRYRGLPPSSAPARPSAATPSYTVRTLHFLVHTDPKGGTPCDIIGDLYTPRGASPTHRVPAILTTNGFGGSKDDQAGLGKAFASRGYEVLSYSGLGFGGSGCKITLDDPDYDGRAGSQLVSLPRRRAGHRVHRRQPHPQGRSAARGHPRQARPRRPRPPLRPARRHDRRLVRRRHPVRRRRRSTRAWTRSSRSSPGTTSPTPSHRTTPTRCAA